MKLDSSICEEEIERVVGRSALITLEKAYGRSYLYIRASKPDKALVKLIGKDKAQKMTNEFGGSEIWVPKRMLKVIRNHQIAEERGAGKTIKELAAEFNLTRYWIAKILQEKGYGEYNPKS
jgi:hypothetical protein